MASQVQKITRLFRGQQVEGEVVAITDKEVTLDLGTKAEGILRTHEIPQDQLKDLKIGDKLKAFVYMTENESGQVVLSSHANFKFNDTSIKGHGTFWSKFIHAQNQKTKLQARVVEVNKGGLIVESEGTRGFLPNSQVGFELLSKGLTSLIGQSLSVIVIEIDQEENRLIFSQRGQVSPEIKTKLHNFKKDQKTTGKIVAILPFGLVIDVGGIEGLVAISDVSWERTEDLSKLYKIGEEIDVLVLGVDEDLGRLNLSVKQLSQDPFVLLTAKYQADEVVKGEVTSVSEAGVSVKLEEGIEGLLPASKMNSDTIYNVGETVKLLMGSVDAKRRRINLIPMVTSTSGLIYK